MVSYGAPGFMFYSFQKIDLWPETDPPCGGEPGPIISPEVGSNMPVDNTVIAKMYIDAVQNGSIEAAALTKLPELVTCNDWTRVEVVGSINYLSERTKVVYNGILVKYSGGLYYVRRKLADALGNIDKRFKNVKRAISVVL